MKALNTSNRPVQLLNVLAASALLSESDNSALKKSLKHEHELFNKLHPSGTCTFTRKPKKIGGKWYIEQLANNGREMVNVLVHKIKGGQFKESLFPSHSKSMREQLEDIGLKVRSIN